MTDDRSLERSARSWIEAGPTRAPERAVQHALTAIETTPQERDFGIPRRLPIMNTAPRLAAAAAIVVLAVGGAAYLLRPAASNVGTIPPPTATAPPVATSAASDARAALVAYRSARDAVCTSLSTASPIPDVNAKVDPSGQVTFLRAVVARGTDEVSRLQAIEAPPSIAAEHLANIQTLRDVLALLNHEIDLVQLGKVDEAITVDQATGSLSALFEQFEAKYTLRSCP